MEPRFLLRAQGGFLMVELMLDRSRDREADRAVLFAAAQLGPLSGGDADEIMNAWYDGGTLPTEPIVITFDNGYVPQAMFAAAGVRSGPRAQPSTLLGDA
jgi:hypothetical protein